MEGDTSVSDIYRQLVDEKNLTLSAYLDQLRPQLLSEIVEERETGITQLTNVIQKLPNDYLTGEQVGLLLDFLIGRLESAGLAAGSVLDGIKHLILNASKKPDDFEIPVILNLFKEGNVQGWAQKDRMKHYEILQWMLTHRKEKLAPLGSDFVMIFIQVMGGERDPRCLLTVFRLFVTVANCFPLGPFVEELFEVVGCYYPVEFKPPPGDDAITRDTIANACCSCLLSHPSFAPFCYMLIEEKFTEDDVSDEHKIDVCRLLADACEFFPPSSILPHLNVLLGGIRSVGLDPKNKGEMPSIVPIALSAIVSAVEKTGKDNANQLAANLLENLEPFVLQAEMGLTCKALALLKCVAEKSTFSRTVIVNRCFGWIIALVQGDTINTSANKVDIMTESLQFIAEWVQLAASLNIVNVLAVFESTLFAAIQVAREIVPTKAMSATYKSAKVFLQFKCASDELWMKCSDLLAKGVTSVESEEERNDLLQFITAHSSSCVDWKTQHGDIVDRRRYSSLNWEKYVSVLCASVVNESTWTCLQENIFFSFKQNISPFALSSFVLMSSRVNSSIAYSASQLLYSLIESELKDGHINTDKHSILTETFQSLGLLLEDSSHKEITESMIGRLAEKSIINSQLTTIMSLLLVQTKDLDQLHRLLDLVSSVPSVHILFYMALVNKSEQKIDISEKNELPYRCASAKANLLAGRSIGVEHIKKIFSEVSSGTISSDSISFVGNILQFDGAENDPILCRMKTSFLWKQRIFCQIIGPYMESAASATSDGLVCILLLLPYILFLANSIGNVVQQQCSQLLPVFVSALSSSINPAPVVLSALPAFLTGVRQEQLSRKDITIVVTRLCDVLSQSDISMTCSLDCLSSLELLARRCSPSATQPSISIVVSAATVCLGNKKRLVRKKAADVKNTWESLTSK